MTIAKALESKMWKGGITIASRAVQLNKFLDWVFNGKWGKSRATTSCR